MTKVRIEEFEQRIEEYEKKILQLIDENSILSKKSFDVNWQVEEAKKSSI